MYNTWYHRFCIEEDKDPHVRLTTNNTFDGVGDDPGISTAQLALVVHPSVPCFGVRNPLQICKTYFRIVSWIVYLTGSTVKFNINNSKTKDFPRCVYMDIGLVRKLPPYFVKVFLIHSGNKIKKQTGNVYHSNTFLFY